MSTRSNIGVENSDGTVTFVYCHFDGYPDHHGPILTEHYATEELARKLVSHGDISQLCASCDKPDGHSYEKPTEGHTVYYGRDRGEDGTQARTSPKREAIEDFDQAYGYLFRGGAWHFRSRNGEFEPLTKSAWERSEDE